MAIYAFLSYVLTTIAQFTPDRFPDVRQPRFAADAASGRHVVRGTPIGPVKEFDTNDRQGALI